MQIWSLEVLVVSVPTSPSFEDLPITLELSLRFLIKTFTPCRGWRWPYNDLISVVSDDAHRPPLHGFRDG